MALNTRDVFENLKLFSYVTLFFFAAWVSILFLLLLTGGCASLTQGAGSGPVAKPDTLYKMDLAGTINGYNFSGYGVVPKAGSYRITLESQVNVDLFTIDSCHRSFSLTNAAHVDWLTPKKKIKYDYTPNDIELKSGCMLLAGSFTQDESNVSARALFDFEDSNPLFSLPAVVDCSGEKNASAHGVSMCQAKAGLIQAIKFLDDVRLGTVGIRDECKIPEPHQGAKDYWEYKIKRGVCTYIFKETGPVGRLHRLTTIGYDQIRVRGVN